MLTGNWLELHSNTYLGSTDTTVDQGGSGGSTGMERDS